MLTRVVHLPDLNATGQLARDLIPFLQQGGVVALQGDLGAGKTTFARALLQVLGVEGDIPSPTFTLVQTYDVQHLSVFHFDLYRLKSGADLEELGWEDALSGGLALIEWPERATGYMPEDYLVLRLSLTEARERICVLEPQGSWVDRMKDIP